MLKYYDFAQFALDFFAQQGVHWQMPPQRFQKIITDRK